MMKLKGLIYGFITGLSVYGADIINDLRTANGDKVVWGLYVAFPLLCCIVIFAMQRDRAVEGK